MPQKGWKKLRCIPTHPSTLTNATFSIVAKPLTTLVMEDSPSLSESSKGPMVVPGADKLKAFLIITGILYFITGSVVLG